MNLRNLAIWAVIVVVLIALYSVLNPSAHTANTGEIPYSQLLQKVDADQVKDVVIRGETVQARDAAGRRFQTTTPASQEDLLRRLEGHGANIQVQSAQPSAWMQILSGGPAAAAAGRHLGLLHAPDAGRRARGDGLRQVQGQAADREQDQGHLRRRGRGGRSQGRAERDRRLPQGPGQVPAPGRQDPQGGAAGGPSRHRQDPARPRRRGGGGRAVLLHLRLGLRGDVRGRGRQPGARHVRTGQEERALHHLHRRDRRGGPSPRRWTRRRQ